MDELLAVLTSLAARQNLRERAFEGYRGWIRDSQRQGEDSIEGWEFEEIEARFVSYSLVFVHEELNYPFVDTRLQLVVRDRGGSGQLLIGYYRLITLLDGTEEDDYFVINFPKPSGG